MSSCIELAHWKLMETYARFSLHTEVQQGLCNWKAAFMNMNMKHTLWRWTITKSTKQIHIDFPSTFIINIEIAHVSRFTTYSIPPLILSYVDCHDYVCTLMWRLICDWPQAFQWLSLCSREWGHGVLQKPKQQVNLQDSFQALQSYNFLYL